MTDPQNSKKTAEDNIRSTEPLRYATENMKEQDHSITELLARISSKSPVYDTEPQKASSLHDKVQTYDAETRPEEGKTNG